MRKASPGANWSSAPRNLNRTFRFCALALLTALIPSVVLAHKDPPGASSSGVSILMNAFRSDGVTPILPGTVSGCGETIIYRATLAWAGGSNAAIQGGTLTIVTPDGLPHDATPVGGVPCLGGTDGVICTPGVVSIDSMDVPYTVVFDPACTPGTTLVSSVTYSGGIAHLGTPDSTGVGAMTPFNLDETCCAPTETPTPTPTNTPTNTPINSPTPTNTPTNTNTPSGGPPPSVPTLSFPMMALLGIILAGAGLFLARRQ
jgi:hypothetical protein